MRALFFVSGEKWNAHARAFVLAARGLKARGHEILLACASDCPVQVRAAASELPVMSLNPEESATGSTLQIRRALKEQGIDVVFVHSDGELMMASSAMRLGRGAGMVIRRIPPFSVGPEGRGARLATRIASTGLLFSTEVDRQNADMKRRLPAAVAPLSVDPTEHDAAAVLPRAAIGAPANSTLIICVHDGEDRHKVLAPLRALALLAPRHPELHLGILGGARQEELRMQGAALGVNAMVSYLGARDDELSVLRAADVGWVAGNGDAAALAALDFMACRTPVLAERTALTEHYVADGIAGVLLPPVVTPADTTSVAASVAAFLAKKEQRTAMGNAGRARLQREFSYEAMIRGYEQAAAAATGGAAKTVA
jgi:hypothetical protein